MNSHAAEHVLHVALLLHDQNPPWQDFFERVFGISGAIAQAFPSPKDRALFQQTAEYARCESLLAELRGRDDAEPNAVEMTVITVRLSKYLHSQLKAEAHASKVSLNKLCVRKLVVPERRAECAPPATLGGVPVTLGPLGFSSDVLAAG